MNANLKGSFFVTQAVVKHLKETQRPGKIINISSVHRRTTFSPFHCLLRQQGWHEDDDAEPSRTGTFGITVNNVAPGIQTPINKALLNDSKTNVHQRTFLWVD